MIMNTERKLSKEMFIGVLKCCLSIPDGHPQPGQVVPLHQFPYVAVVCASDVEVAAAVGPPPEPAQQA